MKQKQCTSSPDTAGDFLPTSSSDTRQLSLLSGIPTPAKSSENEQQTDGSQTCECGKGTFNCLIHPNTPEKWTAFMQDSLAKTLALLENRQAYMREPDQVFTEKSCVSLAWYDQSNSSWKTYQQSLVTGWEPYSETWPRWGMTQGGSAYVHPMSERRITETDGSYWLTPRVMEIEETVDNFRARMNRKRPNDRKNGYASLSMQVKDGFNPMWPTPAATDYKGSGKTGELRDRLDYAVERGATKSKTYETNQTGGQLNPTWVEWLMGFPIGFTVSKDWVMPKSRSKQQPPTDSSGESDAT